MASLAGERPVSARKEKFGKFVLLEQLDATTLGVDYRAAKLGSAGLEKIVQLLRLTPTLSSSADSAKLLMDQAKFAAQLQNSNVLKIFGIGKVEGSYYISYEFVEGKSLKTIFGRCRSEGFPFSVDHALLIASKICSALEYAHGRKLDSGGRYFHGLVTPTNVMVSYEGEVRLRGFGYWPSGVRELGLVGDEEIIHLAPEQASGSFGEPRSDTFAVGTILFEALTGQPLLQPDRRQDVAARITQARLQGPSGDEDALPKPIADILHKALAPDLGARYGEIQEMRKAIDTLLFSGDFTPTTFNLAFFMHSLFREDIERESKVLKEEKEASYFDFLEDAKGTAPAAGEAKSAPVPTPAPAPVPVMQAPPPTPSSPAPLPLIPPPPREERAAKASHAAPHTAPHAAKEASHPHVSVGSREAAAGFTFHKDSPAKGKGAMIGLGILVLALVGGGVAFMTLRGGGSQTAPTAPTAAPVATLSPEALAAQEKVKELEAQLAAIKSEQEASAAKAAEEARKKAIADAERRKQTVSAEELARVEEAARQKGAEEARKRAEEQQRRIEEEKRLEEQRLADEKARAEESARKKAAEDAAAAATAAQPAGGPSTASAPVDAGSAPAAGGAVKVGDLLSVNDVGVVRPEYVKKVQPTYPFRALAAKVEGTVVVNALVDENGKVTDTQILQRIEHPLGVDLNNAAVLAVRSSTFKPATKDGVRVKVWLPVPIQFRIKRG